MTTIARITAPIAAAALAAGSLLSIAAVTEDGREYGPYFGDDMPEVCEAEMEPTLADGSENPDYWYADAETAECHHMAGDMNGLDDPVVDVLIVPPASPAPERDLRIMRQSLEMWDAGIDVVAQQLGMEWLAEGFDIRVSVGGVEYGATDEVNPEALYDPEIVVIASNPVGGIGIGVDPVSYFLGGDIPCLPVEDPGDFSQWQQLDRFDDHHDTSGTYVVRGGECGDNLGGDVCFAINGAIDPTPGPSQDMFSLYDLVSHEVGHCLTIGHVGDGAEGSWSKVPTNDIMAYDTNPEDRNKCVSTLNVVGIAHVMARYLDVDGDGEVGTDADQALVAANDPDTEDGRPFFVHRPEDQFYASTSGWAWDCPQPDLALTPGERVDFHVEPEWTPLDADGRDVEGANFCWQALRRTDC